MALRWILVAIVASIVVAVPLKKSPIVNINKEELLRALENPTGPGARNPVIEGIISSALEDLRQIMLTGTDDIPILDPLQLDRISVDDQIIPFPGARVEINDLTVNKLSTFVIADLSVNTAWPWITRYNIVLDGYIPEVDVDARNYDLNMDVFGLNMFGNGDASMKFIEPRLKLEMQIGVTISLSAVSVVVRECTVAISLADVQFNIKGLFNDPTVDDFVNLFLRNLILELLDVFSDDITDAISPIVLEVANDILADLNLIDLIGS